MSRTVYGLHLFCTGRQVLEGLGTWIVIMQEREILARLLLLLGECGGQVHEVAGGIVEAMTSRLQAHLDQFVSCRIDVGQLLTHTGRKGPCSTPVTLGQATVHDGVAHGEFVLGRK